MLQVDVFKSACSQEYNLKFLSFGDQSCKQTHLFWLIFLCWWLNFIELVGSGRHGVARLKFLGIDGIPVEEEVSDGAVILGQVVNQS